jgi:hypothetical protein
MDKKCAPGKKFTEGTCFTLEDLKEIATNYNNRYSDKIQIDNLKTKRDFLRELIPKFKKQFECDDQICWLSKAPVKAAGDDIKNYTFRPNGPKKQFAWLSTEDIESVMKQYEKVHTDFKFLGAIPSDFDELPIYETTDLEFAELEKKTPKIGAIINLDTHNQPGSHWVALYANLKTNSIYYFDSFKKQPQNRVRKFITRLLGYMVTKKQDTKLDIKDFLDKYEKSNDYDIRYNQVQHQYKNSECGVYSLNFIIRLLEGETFDDIVNNITNDDKMNKYRETVFRNANFD